MIEEKYDPNKVSMTSYKESKVKNRLFLPKIDLKKCTQCTLCVVLCPHDAIEIRKDSFPSVIKDKCTGCLVCLRECPWAAIIEEREINGLL